MRVRGAAACGVPILGAALVAALVASAGAASTNFVEPASSPEQVGAGPQGVVVVDLDGDGDRDLATANGSNGSVTVLRNNGAANFAPFASSPEDVGSFPTAITAADIDGDADQDLLVADQLDDAIYVLRNNGNANFTQPATSPEPAGDTPAEIAAADLDDDGDTDLAIANAIESTDTDNVTILLNNGNGNFAPAPTSPEDAGNKPVAIAAADLDGDGDPDLATADQQSNTVTVLRNNGSANFNEASGSPELAGSFPQDIVAARLDADASIDLAAVNQGSSSENVTILRNSGQRELLPAGHEPGARGRAAPEPDGGRLRPRRRSGPGDLQRPRRDRDHPPQPGSARLHRARQQPRGHGPEPQGDRERRPRRGRRPRSGGRERKRGQRDHPPQPLTRAG